MQSINSFSRSDSSHVIMVPPMQEGTNIPGGPVVRSMSGEGKAVTACGIAAGVVGAGICVIGIKNNNAVVGITGALLAAVGGAIIAFGCAMKS